MGAYVNTANNQNGEALPIYQSRGNNSVSYDASAQSAAFGADTCAVRLCSTTSCYVVFGANPTATSSGILLPALSPLFMTVTAGQKVAAIKVADAGVLSVVEL